MSGRNWVDRTTRERWAASAAVLIVVSALVAACAPSDRFYRAPAEMPDRPGGIARSFVVDNPLHDHHMLLYRSTDSMGEAILVSGTVLVPDVPWIGPGPRPVVTFASATQGIGDGCVPSRNLANGVDQNLIYTEPLLAAGYAVVISDYEGLGTAAAHTFGVADPSAKAVIDMVRAAFNYAPAGLDPAAPVAIVGYSQGGQAAARAAEIVGSYAPELNVVSAVAGGVPSSLTEVGDHLNNDGILFFALLAFTATGLDAAYPELDLARFLNAEGRELLEQSENLCMAEALATIQGPIDRFTTSNPLETPAWKARIEQQTLGRIAPTVPVLLTHPREDQIVPYNQGVRLRDAWCGRGATVYWYPHEGEHISGAFYFLGAAYDHLAVVFNQSPLGSPHCN